MNTGMSFCRCCNTPVVSSAVHSLFLCLIFSLAHESTHGTECLWVQSLELVKHRTQSLKLLLNLLWCGVILRLDKGRALWRALVSLHGSDKTIQGTEGFWVKAPQFVKNGTKSFQL